MVRWAGGGRAGLDVHRVNVGAGNIVGEMSESEKINQTVWTHGPLFHGTKAKSAGGDLLTGASIQPQRWVVMTSPILSQLSPKVLVLLQTEPKGSRQSNASMFEPRGILRMTPT